MRTCIIKTSFLALLLAASTAVSSKAQHVFLDAPAAVKKFTPVTDVPFTGTTIAELQSHPGYPDSPNSTDTAIYLEYPKGSNGGGAPPANVDNNYGIIVSGTLSVDQTGDYVFWLAADDNAEFWLSEDSDPANAVTIATEPGWNPVRFYITDTGGARTDGAPENVSAPVTLTVGQTYAYVGYMKEGGGGDNFAVAARLASAPAVTDGAVPIFHKAASANITITSQPSSTAAVAGNTATFAVDTSGPGFYQWKKNGVDIPGATGRTFTTPALATADNNSKYSVVVTPVTGSPVTSNEATLSVIGTRMYSNGVVEYAAWDLGTTGDVVPTLDDAITALGSPIGSYAAGGGVDPDVRTAIDAFDSRVQFPANNNDNYTGAIFGQFVPDVTGPYYFHLKSDDPGRLYFNSTGPALPELIEDNLIANQTGCCNDFASAPSVFTGGPFTLTAGQAYGFVGLYHEGGGDDYLQVAFSRNGSNAGMNQTDLRNPSTIPSSFLRAVNPVEGPQLALTTHPQSMQVEHTRNGTFTVANTAAPSVTYQWQSAPAGSSTFTDIAGATGSSLTVTANLASNDMQQYRVRLNAAEGQTATSDIATLDVLPDATGPTVVAAASPVDRTKVTVMFNEAMHADTANAANFSLSGGATVTGAVLANTRTIVLTTGAALTAGTSYTVTANPGAKDLTGNPVSTTANTATFTPSATPTGQRLAGRVLYERWEGVSGGLAGLQTAIDAGPPTATEVLSAFNHPGFGTALGTYGVRMTTYFVPPSDGDYKFFHSSDDVGGLWLSTDSDPANKKQIASEPLWGANQQWVTTANRDAANPQNRSRTWTGTQWPTGNLIGLAGGKEYYLELRFVEGGGGDNGGATFVLGSAADPADGTATALTGNAIAGYFDLAIIPPVITQAPGGGRVYNKGETLTSTVTAIGPNLTYQWFKNKTEPIAGATGPTLTISNADEGDVGDYSVEITNENGVANTWGTDNNVRFIMSNPSFHIETEDFNHTSGQHVAAASQMPYQGNAYFGLMGVQDVDHYNVAGPRDGANAYGRNAGVGSALGGVETKGPNDPADYQRGSHMVDVNYGVGWTDIGSWWNFTRNFPKGTHQVYYGVAYGGTGENQVGFTLSKVTDATIPDGEGANAQGATAVGVFNSRGTGAWSSNDLVPMTNPDLSGAYQTITFAGGVETIRLTQTAPQGDGDTDFLLFYCTDCPTVAITSPANNATIAEGTAVPITVNTTASSGTISKVEYFANGTKLGESTTAPFSFTVPGAAVVAGAYSITARATDSDGRVGNSVPINVTVGTPKKVFFLHGAGGPNGSDQAVIDSLRAAGLSVTARPAPGVVTADATGFDLIVGSSTVGSADIGAKFKDLAIPYVGWEQAVQDDFQMTGPADPADRGTVTAQNSVEIVNAAHPMAAGLAAGTVRIYNNNSDVTYGVPAAGATVIARPTGAANATRAALYGYDTGATLVDGSAAPARRVHVFMGDTSYGVTTDAGKALVEAAFEWALAGSSQPPGPRLSVSRSGNQLTITWTPSGGTLWQADTITGQWTSTNDSDGTFVTTMDQPHRFYMIRP